jgi:hypothetical protein
VNSFAAGEEVPMAKQTPKRRDLTPHPDDPLATFIRQELAKRDLLASDAAAQTGLSSATLSFWTRGIKVPSVHNVSAFAEMLAAFDGRPNDQELIDHYRNTMLRLGKYLPESSTVQTAHVPDWLRGHPGFASLVSTLAQAGSESVDEALEMVNLVLQRYLRRWGSPEPQTPPQTAVPRKRRGSAARSGEKSRSPQAESPRSLMPASARSADVGDRDGGPR